MLSPLLCAAQEFARDTGALFGSFQVPKSTGTFPLSINDSLTITGYYTQTVGPQRGFVRYEGGAIDTFDVPGSMLTEPVSINTAGDIVGYYEVTPGVPQCFLRSADGQITTFAAPTDASIATNKFALPVSINAAGTIVGNYPDVAEASRVFIRSATGVITTFSLSEGAEYSTVATGMNAGGAVIGYATSSSINDAGGFLWYGDGSVPSPVSGTGLADFAAIPGATGVFPAAINAFGATVGWFSIEATPPFSEITPNVSASGAFLRSPDGVIAAFNPPGALLPSYLGINAANTIFGNYSLQATPAVSHGFVRSEEGIVISFDPAGSSSTTATSINDSGIITGFYYDASGKVASGFLRVP
jgi:hypothetical protein